MKRWHHAPPHDFNESGTYMVTGGTLYKAHVFRSRDRLDYLQETLWDFSTDFDCRLESWSVFSNHYHFIGQSENSRRLAEMLREFHRATATKANFWDHAPGRQVWYQFRETRLTFQRSYLARLRYVHENPVKHGLVRRATLYPWCSASWFEREGRQSFVRTVNSFKIDRLNVFDPFDPELSLE